MTRATDRLLHQVRRIRWRARLRWQYEGKRRLGRLSWLSEKLPWVLWCRLCASDGKSVVAELGRRVHRPITLVQIGANDGLANDPISATVRERRWTGVLVEPLPLPFQQLVANYGDVPHLRFANVAIGPRDSVATLHTVSPRLGDPDWVTQIASLDQRVVMKHAGELPGLAERIVPVDVESLRLQTFVQRYELETIDLLHIDAEGLDHEILSQLVPDATWLPLYLLFEAKHMTRDQYDQITRRLSSFGYRFVHVWPDEFAYRERPD